MCFRKLFQLCNPAYSPEIPRMAPSIYSPRLTLPSFQNWPRSVRCCHLLRAHIVCLHLSPYVGQFIGATTFPLQSRALPNRTLRFSFSCLFDLLLLCREEGGPSMQEYTLRRFSLSPSPCTVINRLPAIFLALLLSLAATMTMNLSFKGTVHVTFKLSWRTFSVVALISRILLSADSLSR